MDHFLDTDPTEYYRGLVQSITDDDVHRVGNLMLPHVGEKNLILLPDLVRHAFGKYTASTERKTRDILEILTLEYGLPVCSYSGKSGRWLAGSEEEKERCASELERRANSTLARARALRRAVIPPPQQLPRKQPVVQVSLF